MAGQKSPVLRAKDEQAAAQALAAAGKTDGLPVVVPTPQRVEEMLLHAPNLPPQAVLGSLLPAGGELTVEKAAINAVMAGCPVETFPWVIAACEAICDPRFDLGPLQSTTHCVTPLVIVNGPSRYHYGFTSGVQALGPGQRANATLGRTLRLIMLNVGGGAPGVGDMATLGSPAKFTCCLAEAEEENPYDPLHVALGFDAADDVVTVIGVEGPHSLIFTLEDFEGNEEALLRTLGAGIANPASNNIYFGNSAVVAMLNPFHMRILSRKGLSYRDIQQRLYNYASVERKVFESIVGLQNANMSPQTGERLHAVRRPEDFLLLVAGQEGGAYSVYFPSWGGGVAGQHPVSKKVRLDDGCEIPASIRR
ncbi:MAG: hypothetical protein WC997_02690 [Porticoccaceae bacterium]